MVSDNAKSKEQLIRELQDMRNSYQRLRVECAEDVARLREAEVALRESESKYRLLAQNSSDVIWTLDNSYRFTYISPSIYSLRGLTQEEAMNEAIQDTMTPDSRIAVNAAIEEGMENERANKYSVPVHVEIEQYHKLGHLVWVAISIRSMLNDNGEKIGYVGISHDITMRKIAENELKTSEKKFRTLADMAKIAISIIGDVNGQRYLYVNEEWSRVFGYTKEEAGILSPMDVIDPDDRNRVLENAAKRLKGEQVPQNYEVKSLTKYGEIKYLDFSSTIIDFEGRKAFLTTSLDITKRRMAEEALRNREEQLRELNAQKDKFFSIIAHDLKGPFSSIIGFSELLLEQINKKDYDEIGNFAAIIDQSSKQALDLLTNLLEWSRAHTGRMRLNPVLFDLNDLIVVNKRFYDFIANAKEISVTLDVPDELKVVADSKMIETVMRNLISNAVKFTPNGGEVAIKAELKDGEVLVSVKDNGVGIEKDRIGLLFGLNSSISTLGTNKERGTGLGLILCKEFIDKNKGKIWVESEPGMGSVFYFSLPYVVD